MLRSTGEPVVRTAAWKQLRTNPEPETAPSKARGVSAGPHTCTSAVCSEQQVNLVPEIISHNGGKLSQWALHPQHGLCLCMHRGLLHAFGALNLCPHQAIAQVQSYQSMCDRVTTACTAFRLEQAFR